MGLSAHIKYAIISIQKAAMIIFFNLSTLEEQSCNTPDKFMSMLEYHYSKRLPSKYAKLKPSKVPLHGSSFLLNFVDLFNDMSTDILFKMQYVKLASRRDYNLYKQYGFKALSTSFFPDLNYDALRSNPLLQITPTIINFKYE